MRGKIKMQNYFRICVMLLLCLVPNILGKAVLVPGKTDSGDVEKKQINAQSHILQNQNLNDVEENDMNQGNANKKNSDTLRVEPMQVEEPLKKLDKEDLNPPDHLDAVRMEQDGHLNKDWRKEVFLGEHEDFDQSTREEQDQKLKMVFYRYM
ncbi:unnamed protein product [Owenia fusiformis]|uniref:Uncharacterized protein n=1 Tax=Owenia fusiformis TaxID=6347 RepID=A0A8S4QAY6_OWEFU|nr:unnamed protein product [Owenia fusiformis]